MPPSTEDLFERLNAMSPDWSIRVVNGYVKINLYFMQGIGADEIVYGVGDTFRKAALDALKDYRELKKKSG